MQQHVKSHPTRVRGLKQLDSRTAAIRIFVAPHAGAWIETRLADRELLVGLRRTPRGCVD